MNARLAAILGLDATLIAVLIGLRQSQAYPFMGDVLLLLGLVAVSCAVLGQWLVLRRMAMMADAIAHAILFGIVMMFWALQRGGAEGDAVLGSPSFIVGAALAGVLTVFLTESLIRTRLVREDAAIGLVFSFLFALALVIIALRFRDVHLDEHLVMAGGVENTVFRQWIVSDATLPGWLSASVGGWLQALAPEDAVRVTREGEMTILRWVLGPRAAWTMGAMLLVNLAFLAALWKELKLSTFDAGLAASLGFAPVLLNYALMSLVSVTAVGAFEAVGSIIVIALFIAPPATAYLLTEDLLEMGLLGAGAALLSVILGFQVALRHDLNFGGSVALASGLVFGACLLFAPRQGLVTQSLARRRQRRSFALDLLLVHLANHEGTPEAARENRLENLPVHLRWSPERLRRIVARAADERLLSESAGQLVLTESGRSRALEVLED